MPRYDKQEIKVRNKDYHKQKACKMDVISRTIPIHYQIQEREN